MKKTKHTPGPWFATEIRGTQHVESRSGAGLLEVAACGPAENAGQHEANARLIAAAPLLLEALQDAEQRMRGQLILLKCDDEFIARETAMARAAIAAATN